MARNGICALAAAVAVLGMTACGGDKEVKPAQPAERHLVYVYGPDPAKATVWIADVDGANGRRLTSGNAAVLSPDGRTVAVSRGKRGIFLVSSDGKRERRLTARNLQLQAWSPDGETLVTTAADSQAVRRLVAIDRRSGRSRVLARGSLYGFDFSPKGDEIVYSRAPVATDQGICGDQFDVYKAKLDGGTPEQLTHDGLSGFPVWGAGGIAFSHFPSGGTLEDCSAPGVWTMDTDGSHVRHVVDRAPDSIVLLGFYGMQPLGWLDDRRVLVGLRSDYGTQGAVLDTENGKLRRLNNYADKVSSDGRFSVGSGGDLRLALSILRLGDGHRVFRRQDACCPDWNR